MDNKNTKCSFCKKPLSAVDRFIAGSDVNICDQCITACHDILVGNQRSYLTAEWLYSVQKELKILTDQFCR